ncbi:MAG TPA: TlpA disulfide reductase family protein [Actinomycetota bacterium]|nr:TlpA disulfide reductase family protein [Actinomycetota bacterium]
MPASKKPANNRPLIFGAALVVILAVVAFFATRGEDAGGPAGEEPEQVRPVAVEGQPLAQLSASGQDPAVGQTAPSIRGTGFDGDAVNIEPGSQPRLVIFVAHWCPHCQREVPKIVQWLEDSGTPQGLDMIVVATATDPNRPNYPPSEWLEEEGLDLSTMADDRNGTAAQAYGLSAYPYFVLMDANNRVIARDSGELSTEELDELVELAGNDS